MLHRPRPAVPIPSKPQSFSSITTVRNPTIVYDTFACRRSCGNSVSHTRCDRGVIHRGRQSRRAKRKRVLHRPRPTVSFPSKPQRFGSVSTVRNPAAVYDTFAYGVPAETRCRTRGTGTKLNSVIKIPKILTLRIQLKVFMVFYKSLFGALSIMMPKQV